MLLRPRPIDYLEEIEMAIQPAPAVHQAAQIQQTQQPRPTSSSTASKYAAPQDTVNISSQAKAASQAEKSGGDADHDGDSK